MAVLCGVLASLRGAGVKSAGAGGVLGGREGGAVVERPAAKRADAKSAAVEGAAVEGATVVRRMALSSMSGNSTNTDNMTLANTNPTQTREMKVRL